jgi:hypothetical protein
MYVRPALELELQRQIAQLRGSDFRLSLMSVASLSSRSASFPEAVRAAAAPFDAVGLLRDGSIGVLSLRGLGTDGGAGVEQRFLPRLQAALQRLGRLTGGEWFWFRSVHRWASELSNCGDILDTLFDMPARLVKAVEPSGILPGYPPIARQPLGQQPRDHALPGWRPLCVNPTG